MKEWPTYWTTESHLVRDVGETHEAETTENVNGDCEVLSLECRMPHLLENGWQEGAEAIQKDVLAKLNGAAARISRYSSYVRINSPDINLWICGGYFNLIPTKVLATAVGLVSLISDSHKLLLLLAQEVGISWIVWETEEHNYSADHTEQTLDNIDPSVIKYQ